LRVEAASSKFGVRCPPAPATPRHHHNHISTSLIHWHAGDQHTVARRGRAPPAGRRRRCAHLAGTRGCGVRLGDTCVFAWGPPSVLPRGTHFHGPMLHSGNATGGELARPPLMPRRGAYHTWPRAAELRRPLVTAAYRRCSPDPAGRKIPIPGSLQRPPACAQRLTRWWRQHSGVGAVGGGVGRWQESASESMCAQEPQRSVHALFQHPGRFPHVDALPACVPAARPRGSHAVRSSLGYVKV